MFCFVRDLVFVFFRCTSSVKKDWPFFAFMIFFGVGMYVVLVSDFLFLGSFLVVRLVSAPISSIVSSILSPMLGMSATNSGKIIWLALVMVYWDISSLDLISFRWKSLKIVINLLLHSTVVSFHLALSCAGGSAILRGTTGSTTWSVAVQCFRNSYLDTAFALSFKTGRSGSVRLDSILLRAHSESDATPDVEGLAPLFSSVVLLLSLLWLPWCFFCKGGPKGQI